MSRTLRGIKVGILTLASIDDLFDQCAGFGYTRRGFVAFLNALGVPYLETPDGTKLVDLSSFQLALKTATRLGAPNFISPGAPSVYANGGKGVKNSRRLLEPADYYDHWRELIGELSLSANLNVETLPTNARAIMETARERIAMGLAQYSARSVANAHRRFREAADTIIRNPLTLDDD